MTPERAAVPQYRARLLPSLEQGTRGEGTMKKLSQVPKSSSVSMTRSLVLCASVAAVVLVAAPRAHGQVASFQGLGFLPNGTSSSATGVNADGTVVVGTGTLSSGGSQAFRWTPATGMVGLGFLPSAC